jgi:hypothetical protein
MLGELHRASGIAETPLNGMCRIYEYKRMPVPMLNATLSIRSSPIVPYRVD